MAGLFDRIVIAQQALKTAKRAIPTLDERVTVEITGQPGSTKQELYYLALAAANGTVRRPAPLFANTTIRLPTVGLLQIEYDAASNWVRCTIHYIAGTTGNSGVLDGSGIFGLGVAGFFNNLAVYRGPQCDVVGGKMDFVSPVLPGIPAGPPSAPILPFAGRVIVTGCPTVLDPGTPGRPTQLPVPTLVPNGNPNAATILSPDPKPPGDNRSRGVVIDQPDTPGVPGTNDNCCPKQRDLIALMFASLSDPGSQGDMRWQAPTPGPQGV